MTTDLTVGHPRKTLWRFLLPMLVSVMFQQFYNIADSMIAGLLSDHGYLHGLCHRKQSGRFGSRIPSLWGQGLPPDEDGHTHSVYLLCGPEHSPDCLRHHFLWAHDEMDQNTG